MGRPKGGRRRGFGGERRRRVGKGRLIRVRPLRLPWHDVSTGGRPEAAGSGAGAAGDLAEGCAGAGSRFARPGNLQAGRRRQVGGRPGREPGRRGSRRRRAADGVETVFWAAFIGGTLRRRATFGAAGSWVGRADFGPGRGRRGGPGRGWNWRTDFLLANRHDFGEDDTWRRRGTTGRMPSIAKRRATKRIGRGKALSGKSSPDGNPCCSPGPPAGGSCGWQNVHSMQQRRMHRHATHG